MRVHVLTAITRPENLPRLAQSLAVACGRAPQIDLSWHWQLDRHHDHVGGQQAKNLMLDRVDWGWIHILDDDTLAHPDLFARLHQLAQNSDVSVIVVSQLRADGRVLPAGPEHVHVGGIDIGQAVFHSSIVNGDRIPESYEGDGLFLQRLVGKLPAGQVAFVDEQLSYHNYLRPGTP